MQQLANNMTIHSYRIAKKKIKHVLEAREKTRRRANNMNNEHEKQQVI
jgi:hypothetical protein